MTNQAWRHCPRWSVIPLQLRGAGILQECRSLEGFPLSLRWHFTRWSYPILRMGPNPPIPNSRTKTLNGTMSFGLPLLASHWGFSSER